MRTILLNPNDYTKTVVRLSDACECGAVTLMIAVSDYEKSIKNCGFSLVLKNPAGVVYRRELVCAGGNVTYTVQDSDTAISGTGEMQLLVTGENGEKVLSRRWETVIDKSLLEEESTEAPEPLKPLIEEVNAAKNAAVEAATKAQQAEENVYAPAAIVKKTETGATITITDKKGTTTADVKNGEQGPRGEKGEKGDTGDCNFATFDINPLTGILAANYTTDKNEITFALNNGRLEVCIE